MLFICYILSLQSCGKKSEEEAVLLVTNIDAEYYDSINGECRDLLIRNKFPKGYVHTLSISLSPTFQEDDGVEVTLYSIIPNNKKINYNHELLWSGGKVHPVNVSPLKKYKEMTEVRMDYILPNKAFSDFKSIYISNGIKKNVLISGTEVRYLNEKLESRQRTSKKSLIYVPIGI